MLDQITPLILTYNEAPNIARALEKLSWAKDVVVVDSLSDDDTCDIATSFPNVRVFQRAFDCHRNQWEFGLKETGIATPWVLALDADYIVSDELVTELKHLQPDTGTAGYRASFIYCIHGKKLRSGIYPPVTVLYRREAASYVQDGHTQRVALEGSVEDLCAAIFHDDRKSLRRWFSSQARYTELETQRLLATDRADLGLADRLRRWHLIIPPMMLVYCLIVRGGLFDGWAGFHYAFQRGTAELMIGFRLFQKRLNLTQGWPRRATPTKRNTAA